ncbi:MAG: HhH-GPD-type base excision DNA repair protein [Actinomycetota bacterium]
MTDVPLPITGDADADALLAENPFALLLGMLLDQQVPMEWAFRSPASLADRLDGELTPSRLAEMGEDDVEAVFRQKPALHRYPGSMGKRAHALAVHVVDEYGGDTASIWAGAADAGELYRRLRDLPGFGEEKSRIFLALLAKRFDAAPTDWKDHAGPFGDDVPRSAADVDSEDTLQEVRAWKKAQKAKGKKKTD